MSPAIQEMVTTRTELAPQGRKGACCASQAWVGRVVLGVVFAGLVCWSWRKWPDVFIDFGTQVFYAWQIVNGRDLFADFTGFAYVGGGPLSQYYHAFLFKCFGTSLTTLLISSLVVLGVMILGIYEIFRRIADAWTATIIGLVVLTFFCFSQYVWVANYNFVCPYSYEAVHGLLIAMLSVTLLGFWLAKANRWCAAGAGVGLGLVFLTKPELFLALTLTTGVAWSLAFVLRKRFERGFLVRSGIRFVAGGMLPVAISVLYFWRKFGRGDAIAGTAGAWMTLLTSKAPNNAFYQWCLGLDEPWQNARTTLMWFLGYGLGVLALAWCCARFCRNKSVWERCVLVCAVAGLVLWTIDLPWFDCGWALPLSVLAIGGHMGWDWWKKRDERRSPQSLLPILWCAFSFFLLSKMILHSRIWHYGFYLALPAMAMNLYYLNWRLPKSLRGRGFHRGLFRLAICLVFGIGAFKLLGISDSFYAKKTYPVGSGGDQILTFGPEVRPHGEAIAQTVQWLERNTAPASTLAVLPEGLMVNYLARRSNPTRYASLTPLEVAAYGETNILKSYQAHSPDYVALIHRDSSESGLGYFGQDPRYGAAIMRWIKENYEPVWLYGSEPLQNDQGGIRILKRRGVGPQ